MRSGDINAVPFAGLTVWQIEAPDGPASRYQANIRLKRSDGWSVAFGATAEEALDKCLRNVMRGEAVRDPDAPAERARKLIATVADPEADGGTDEWKRRPQERARTERKRSDREDDMQRDGLDLFARTGGQERKRR